ncbi:MAG: glycine--tRNA ligase subunit alpha [Acidobacteriia bacterium]|nr:glycine--tRNA ligase subunit alpha [Terriglobia bacterium]
MNFQDVILKLSHFWAEQHCVIQQPYDIEVGAGTMHPETFFRVLGPQPYRVAYVQPSRRPADGRYGINPNRLEKHTQFQVILKPPPEDVQTVYLRSLEKLGIRLREHDIKFEEDNWEAPTLGAWGMGWQVMLDGLEITQFTYFQQCGGVDLNPPSVEITYGLERIAAFLANVDSVFELEWGGGKSYGDIRREAEKQFSIYNFELADVKALFELFRIYESEVSRLLKRPAEGSAETSIPVLQLYDFCLKCSHLFNVLDARGAFSVSERVSLIGRIRDLTCQVAQHYLEEHTV